VLSTPNNAVVPAAMKKIANFCNMTSWVGFFNPSLSVMKMQQICLIRLSVNWT